MIGSIARDYNILLSCRLKTPTLLNYDMISSFKVTISIGVVASGVLAGNQFTLSLTLLFALPISLMIFIVAIVG